MTTLEKDIQRFCSVDSDILLKSDCRGTQVTVIKTGGLFALFAEVETVAALAKLVRYCNHENVPWRILGNGSNVLVPDGQLPGVTIRLGRGFRQVQHCGAGVFEVGASVSLMRLSLKTAQDGLTGLEFAGGIPASLGGAVWMNAGAHGDEMSTVLSRVTILLPCGTVRVLTTPEMTFSYRKSSFPKGSIVVSCLIALFPSDRESVMLKRQHCLEYRKRTQPLQYPSCGSVFTNPPGKLSAGALLESAGMKGAVVGGAEVSNMHANWIINPRRTASSSDVFKLIKTCQHAVMTKHGIMLEPEVKLWNSTEGV